jgi:hypothetical protein
MQLKSGTVKHKVLCNKRLHNNIWDKFNNHWHKSGKKLNLPKHLQVKN